MKSQARSASRKVIPLLAALLAPLLLLSGCVVVAAGAGAGTVAYIRGELQADLDAPLDRAARATARAVDQLEFSLISEKKDATAAVYTMRTARDQRIVVTLERKADQLTEAKIRVGTFGDQSLSMTVLDAIKANL